MIMVSYIHICSEVYEKAVILVGVPGSGKSTYAKKLDFHRMLYKENTMAEDDEDIW